MSSDLEIINLNASYGDFTIKDVSFCLKPGEVLALVGSNGSGKTTILESLAAIRGSTTFTLRKDGENIVDSTSFLQRNCYLFSSDVPYFGELSVIQNIRFFARLRNKKVTDREIDYFCRMGGIQKHLDKKYSSLSKGLKQRCSLSEMMLARPRYLLMDEPHIGLDPSGKDDINTLLENNTRDYGGMDGIVIATHDLELAKRYANRLIWISEGRIIAEGNFDTLLDVLEQKYFATRLKEMPEDTFAAISRIDGVIFQGFRVLIPNTYREYVEKLGIEVYRPEFTDIFRV